MKDLFEQHSEFCQNTFPLASALSDLIKAESEIEEIKSDLKADLVNVEEYVDVFMCLISSMSHSNITFEKFEKSFREKLEKNKLRKWKHNGNGTYSHVK